MDLRPMAARREDRRACGHFVADTDHKVTGRAAMGHDAGGILGGGGDICQR